MSSPTSALKVKGKRSRKKARKAGVRTPASQRKAARVWRGWFLGALVACAVAVGANLWLSELRPDNFWGLGYGIAATLTMVLVALFGARRRFQRFASRWRMGTAATWLRVHLYAGSLFLVLVLMHSGFRWPQGSLAGWLLVLSLWTTASGWLGLLLQRLVPRMLSSGLSIEVLYERIPELVEEIRGRSERLAVAASEPIRAFYHRDLAPAFSAPQSRWVYYFDVTGGGRGRLGEFDHLHELLGSDERVKLAELRQLFETKLEIDAHYTLQRPLRWWLFVHVPPSCALVVLVAIHIAAVVLY